MGERAQLGSEWRADELDLRFAQLRQGAATELDLVALIARVTQEVADDLARRDDTIVQLKGVFAAIDRRDLFTPLCV